MKLVNMFKMAAAASLVLGAVSGANAAGSNTARVTFDGTIVESPCSVTHDTEDQIVPMGNSIGNGTLASGGKSEAVPFHISLYGCVFTTEKDMNYIFTPGDNTTTATGATSNLAVMSNGTEISNVSLVIADSNSAALKLGETYVQPLEKDGNNVGKATQELKFQAWLQGAATGTVGTGEFSSVANITISYL
ncbi:fimbrial protein [Salmonella enterica subsp. enterica]|nr:fimbrial protein [Salmonella enterica subsp. enterica]